MKVKKTCMTCVHKSKGRAQVPCNGGLMYAMHRKECPYWRPGIRYLLFMLRSVFKRKR